jgi:nitrite reductase/ring-hydroxylating ferredoxin subunit
MVPSFVVGCAAQNNGQAEATGTFSAGSVSDLQPGVPKVLSRPVVVILDDQGVYAMSTICTHAQCDMRTDGDITSNSITCTCHGSEFDVDGNVLKGPAVAKLRHFSVTIDASGEITVDAGTIVPPETRAAIPA